MRRFFLTFLIAAVAVLSAQASRIERSSLKSKILGVEKPYAVYLPDGYDESKGDYPVLYLLHGAKGTYESWINAGALQRIADKVLGEGKARKMIIVLPDARGTGEKNAGPNMGYFNVKDWAYEDHFFEEFIPHIDKQYRTIANKKGRAIAGLSMGGGGAVVYAQHHPELFSACYSTSGRVGMDYRVIHTTRKEYDVAWLWSLTLTSPVDYLRNMPAEQAEVLRTVRWMADCGDDDNCVDCNMEFFAEMRKAKIPMEFRIRNGKHNWPFWRASLPGILRFAFPVKEKKKRQEKR